MKANLLQQNIDLIRQGTELLATLPEGAFTPASDEPHVPAVGPHFRHCLDFYGCFLEGLELRIVDYGSRRRDPSVETDRDTAVQAFGEIVERLSELDPELLSETLELRREGDPEGDEEPEGPWFGSTVGRELQFLLSHTIHHYALIAIALRFGGHSVPEEFGVAPSTLDHRRREGRVAR